MKKSALILFSHKNETFLWEGAVQRTALFSGGAAEKPSHAIFHALRAIKSRHLENACFLRKISITIILALAMLCFSGGAALAGSEVREAELTYRGVTVLLDGDTLVPADDNGNGVEPFILEGTTYLPLRAVAGALGLGVDWDGVTGTVILRSGGEVRMGTGEPLKSSRTQEAELNYRDIKITLDGEELIPRDGNGAVVEPFILEGTTYLPLRAVAGALSLEVHWDSASSTVILQSAGGVADSVEGVSWRMVTVTTSEGTVKAHVLTADPRSPAVNVTPFMAGGMLCSRAGLEDIVAQAGNPAAVITANFMTNDKEGNYPVGNLMIDGELVHNGSGISSIGIKNDGSLICGRPDIRARIVPEIGVFPLWNAVAINAPEEEIADNLSALYTPVKGESFTAVPGGTVMTVSGGAVSSLEKVEAGAEVPIPADGYVFIMTDNFMKYTNSYYRDAIPGEKVQLEYFINGMDADGGFASVKDIRHMISGGPRLVRKGAICRDLEQQFNEARFTTAKTSRICAGCTADGRLILVSSSGTMQAMRELMLSLGCVEAINLDGGASAALYFNGKTLVPEGRLLAYALLIYAG